MESKKFLLQEKDIPTAWYNIVADMENKPLPPLNPKTKEPLKPEDLTDLKKHSTRRLTSTSRTKVSALSDLIN